MDSNKKGAKKKSKWKIRVFLEQFYNLIIQTSESERNYYRKSTIALVFTCPHRTYFGCEIRHHNVSVELIFSFVTFQLLAIDGIPKKYKYTHPYRLVVLYRVCLMLTAKGYRMATILLAIAISLFTSSD